MSASSSVAPGRLASALQESLTTVVRLRAERQPISDAASFRAQITQLLARAEQDALAMGFTTQDARLALFAVVAFLDESEVRLGIGGDLANCAMQQLKCCSAQNARYGSSYEKDCAPPRTTACNRGAERWHAHR